MFQIPTLLLSRYVAEMSGFMAQITDQPDAFTKLIQRVRGLEVSEFWALRTLPPTMVEVEQIHFTIFTEKTVFQWSIIRYCLREGGFDFHVKAST